MTTVAGFVDHYIVLVAPNSVVGTLTLNGVAVSASSFSAISGTTFSSATISVPEGSYVLNSTLPFGASTYGWRPYDSYSYLGGQSFSPVAEVTTVKLTSVNSTAVINTNQCFQTTIQDQNNKPLQNIRVDYSITGVNPQTYFSYTDVNGVSSFCYIGTNAGNDSVTASVGTLSSNLVFNWSATQTLAITCPANQTLNLDANCSSILPDYASLLTITSNSSTTPIVTQNPAAGSVVSVTGVVIITFTVKASNGLERTCNISVDKKDITAPIITCPVNITIGCGSSLLPSVTGTATATDNCNQNIVITYIDNVASISSCGGTIIRTWKASDGNNVSSSQQIITVSPAALPTMAALPSITVACAGLPTSSTISFSNGLSDACLLSGTSDNSTFSTTPAACGGIVTETWTATDICGRTIAAVSRIITVSPAALPAMTAPVTITVACGGLPASSTISFSNGLSNGCLLSGTSVNSTFSATPAICGGIVTETWTATDICGRTIAAVSRIITVSPVALPTMTAPPAVTISLACGALPIPSTLSFTNGLMGGCLINGTSNPSTFVTTAGTCGGTLTEIWTATDVCGRQLSSVSRTVTVAQNLGALQNFVLFSGIGTVSNTGNSTVTGDVGSNMGTVSGFGSPTTITGGIYSGTGNTTNAKLDLLNLYIHLSNIPVTNTTHAVVIGSNETINAGVYIIGGTASMAGNLNLDAKGNAHAIFILKFNGAFSTAANSSITLVNGASAANVFWIAEGAISIGATCTMKGTFIAHTGAASMA